MTDEITNEEITAIFYSFEEFEEEPEERARVREAIQKILRDQHRVVVTRTVMMEAYQEFGGLIDDYRKFIDLVGDLPKTVDAATTWITERLEKEDDPREQRLLQWGQKHGLKCAIYTGCRCEICGEAWQKLKTCEQIVMVEKGTLQDAADELGMTRERVRQIIKLAYPHWSGNAELVRRKEERKRKERLRKRTKCLICNAYVYRKGAKTCGGQCVHDYQLLFRDIDEDRRRAHRVYTATWALRHADENEKIDEDRIRHSKRIIATNGEVVNSQGFWFQEGSKAMEAAIRCYRNGGKAFSMMPEQKQKQVRQYVNRLIGEEEEPRSEEPSERDD